MSRALKRIHQFLIQLDSNRATYPALLDRTLSTCPPRFRPEISEYCAMVLRHRRTLRALISSSSKRILKKSKIEFITALELGCARLISGTDSAEVIASISQLLSGKKNLEKVERVFKSLAADFLSCRPAESDDAQLIQQGLAIPLSGQRVAVFKRDCLGLEGRSTAARLSLTYSLPEPLCQSWLKQFGEFQTAEICQISNDKPPLFARANRLKITVGKLLERLHEEGIEARPCGPDSPDGLLLLRGKGRFRKSALFRDGYFVIQDLTAQEAPLTLEPQAGESILDLCAAPGGKTTYLAELMGNQGRILAVDRKEPRLKRVEEACARLGLSIVENKVADGRDINSLGAESFDRVLVDAPCSNTGVFRRRPEARWRYSVKEQRRFVRDQQSLARMAASRLKSNGFLLYSVCSIEHEEGAGIIKWLLSGSSGKLELVREKLTIPDVNKGDGGYQALLKKH
jgi:16S rRNA (cytosine967-C5)-methyltransferase